MTKEVKLCTRCKGEKIHSLGNKVYECEECGYIFKEFDDTEDVMLRMTECSQSGDVTDSRLYECMSMGIPNIGKLRTFGMGKLHITLDIAESDEVTLTFHYRDKAFNRTVKIKREEPYEFEENGYLYVFSICGAE